MRSFVVLPLLFSVAMAAPKRDSKDTKSKTSVKAVKNKTPRTHKTVAKKASAAASIADAAKPAEAPATPAAQAAEAPAAPAAKPEAPAAKPPAGVEEAAITPQFMHQEDIAKQTVLNRVMPHVPKGQQLFAPTTNIVPFAGHENNPITNGNVVRVYLKQGVEANASRWQRIKAKFAKYRDRSFDVHVDNDGQATILDFQYRAKRYQFGRFLKRVFPVGQLVSDMVKSPKFAEGITTGVLGVGSLALHWNPVIAGAAAMRAFHVLSDGVKEQRALQTKAFDDTTAWAKDQLKTRKIGLDETYTQYLATMKEDGGGSAMSAFDFAQKLSLKGL
jgi:hypothetical protein